MSTCLVVDDSSIVAKVASRILADLGLTTTGASNLDEAFQLLSEVEEGPALVLVSASLSDTTVEASVRALRADARTRGATILVSLVEASLGPMTRAKRAGADGFILRPFDRASLLAWVEPYLKVEVAA